MFLPFVQNHCVKKIGITNWKRLDRVLMQLINRLMASINDLADSCKEKTINATNNRLMQLLTDSCHEIKINAISYTIYAINNRTIQINYNKLRTIGKSIIVEEI